ncbi:MAG: type II secretion system protein N [Marinicellaceae bacterium]
MKLIKYLIYLIIIVMLIVTFTPLNLYYSHIAKEMRPLKLEEISGSLVKGSAEKVTYLGLDVGVANWLVYPSSYDEVTMRLSIKDEDFDFSADLIKSPKSQIIKNLMGTADWKLIDPFLNFNHGKISGYLDFDFKHLEMVDGAVHRILGKVTTKELKLLEPLEKDMGEIEVVFADENPEIKVGQVNSTSNVLNVSGAIYIHKNRRWEVKLTLISAPGEYEIEYALQNIGDRRPGGGRSLNLAGFY